MKCRATSKRTGHPCGGNASPGRLLCHWHGGRSPRGIASANWQHGRYRKHLPQRLAARYATACADPTLLELRDEVALVDARIGELLAHLGTLDATQAAAAADTWAAVLGLVEQRRKLVESERKRLVELQQMLTIEQAQGLIRALAESVRRHVSDRAVLSAIADDLSRLLAIDAGA